MASATSVATSNAAAVEEASGKITNKKSIPPSSSSLTSRVPTILRPPNVLAPLKIDITYRGVRLVDTLTWDIYNPSMLPEEFAAVMCSDMNLPPGMHERITLQIREQIESYQEIINCVFRYAHCIPNWDRKINQTQVITIGIRHGTIDYSDQIDWDPMMENFTPEDFASVTCADLGLPSEMEPAISHKIRETFFRWLLSILQNPLCEDLSLQKEFQVSDSKIALVPGSQTVDMITNLWKRAKPNSIDESAAVPQPQLPSDKESNSEIWLRVKNATRTGNTMYGRPAASLAASKSGQQLSSTTVSVVK
jgi:hypothetical protein